MRALRSLAFLVMVVWSTVTGAITIYADLAVGSDLDLLAVISALLGLTGLLALLTFEPPRRLTRARRRRT